MFEIILVVLIVIVLWKVARSYRLRTYDTVLAFTGGLGAGKSFMSVKKARELLRRKRREVWFYNLFHPKKKKERPMLYSSIPVKVSRKEMAVKLLPEHLLLQRKIVRGSVVFVDEIGGFCSQFDYRVANSAVWDEFVRYFRHYVQGYLICNDQCSENIVLQVRRRLNTVYNMMGFRTFLFVYWVKVRNITVSEEIKTIEEQNTEDNMRTLIGFLPLFRTYDSHCYSVRYDTVPAEPDSCHEEMKSGSNLSCPNSRYGRKPPTQSPWHRRTNFRRPLVPPGDLPGRCGRMSRLWVLCMTVLVGVLRGNNEHSRGADPTVRRRLLAGFPARAEERERQGSCALISGFFRLPNGRRWAPFRGRGSAASFFS